MGHDQKTNDVELIYEDDDILAINKPPGLTVHPTGKEGEKTLTHWIIKRFPKMEKVGEPLTLSSGTVIHRAGILHRLDKETSGVILFAKNQDAFLFFKKQFQNREIRKEYRAIVYGSVEQKTGVIEIPIGRSAKSFTRRAVGPFAKGVKRSALTEFTVLSRADLYSYLSVAPKTGRTHQIRVHLKEIGHPILCDRLYAPGRPCHPSIGRLALHAHILEVRLLNGSLLRLEAPLPQDLTNALTALQLL